jgi:hypothetical protein
VHWLSHRTCCTVIIEHALIGVLETLLSKERAVFVGSLGWSAKSQSFQVSKSQVFIAAWRSLGRCLRITLLVCHTMQHLLQ